MIKAGAHFRPDEVIGLGDFVDNHSISRFAKDPSRDNRLKHELDEANLRLDELDRAFPKAKKIFLEGNHEERLNTFISLKAPELFGLVNTQELLRLKERRWVHFSYGQHYKIGKLIATHGTITRKHSASVMLDKYEHSVVYGHVHTIQEATKVNAIGEVKVAFTPGWLGNLEMADYIKDFVNWGHGFATVHILSDGNFFHQIHRIIGGKTVVNGKVIK